MTIYLAGPMSGYPLYNFPAFDAYRNYLMLQGYKVISPADIDRKFGFDPEKNPLVNFPSKRECARRDVNAICQCDMICMMPGYKRSKGCAMEIAVAKFIGIPAVELDPLSSANAYSGPENYSSVDTA